MPLMTMSSLALIILLLFDLLPGTQKSISCTKATIGYFLVSTMVLYGFEMHMYPELELNCSVVPIFISVWVLYAKSKGKIAGKILLLSFILGITAAIPSFYFGTAEWVVCLFSLLPIIPVFITGDVLSGICTAVTVPIFIELFRFILELIVSGYAFVQFGSAVADVQQMGLLTAVAASELLLLKRNKLENKGI